MSFSPAWSAFLSAFVIAVLTLAGSWVFTHLTGAKPKDRFIQLLIAIGAGYMLGAAFFELLPLAFAADSASPEKQGLIMVGGMLAVILVNQAILGSSQHAHHHIDEPHHHKHSDHDHAHEHDHHQECTHSGHSLPHQAASHALVGLSICSFFDGMTVSSGMLAAKHTGWILLIGQAFHLLPEGIMAAGLSLATGAGRKRAFKASLTIGTVFLMGSLVPILATASALPIFLPISAGIVTYVTLSQLLPEATEQKSGIAAIVVGLIAYITMHELLH